MTPWVPLIARWREAVERISTDGPDVRRDLRWPGLDTLVFEVELFLAPKMDELDIAGVEAWLLLEGDRRPRTLAATQFAHRFRPGGYRLVNPILVVDGRSLGVSLHGLPGGRCELQLRGLQRKAGP